jgi:hypothetical protein
MYHYGMLVACTAVHCGPLRRTPSTNLNLCDLRATASHCAPARTRRYALVSLVAILPMMNTYKVRNRYD